MFPADSVPAIEPATPEMPPYARWGLAAGALARASYATAAGWPAQLHNADSLIPAFVSLEGWSLFYWGQDRFGMLLPLLALPVRDGFWNLVVQNMLGTALLLAGMVASLMRCGTSVPSFRALAGTQPPARLARIRHPTSPAHIEPVLCARARPVRAGVLFLPPRAIAAA